jgi:hypothetical protein
MNELINSIYNARTEVHYNEYRFRNMKGEWIKIDLKGKIRCPVINAGISQQTCSNIMSKETWPRGIDPLVCDKNSCYICESIKKFKEKRKTE